MQVYEEAVDLPAGHMAGVGSALPHDAEALEDDTCLLTYLSAEDAIDI